MISGLRKTLSLITFGLSFTLIAIFVAEVVSLHFLNHATKAFLTAHPAIWRFRDDRAELKIFVRTWLSAVGLLVLTLFGSGTKRTISLSISSLIVMAIPTFLYISPSVGF